jgi:hypothetical protein
MKIRFSGLHSRGGGAVGAGGGVSEVKGGGGFASFKGQAGHRAKVNGEKPPPRPPSIEPVFDAGQRKRLQERYGCLRVVLIDEYEMVSCACFAF